MATGRVLLHHSISCHPHPLLVLTHGRPCNVLNQAITLSAKTSDLSVGDGDFLEGGFSRWLQKKVASAPSRVSRRPAFGRHYASSCDWVQLFFL